MKALIDTNVILDVILRRVPFFADSWAVYNLIEQRKCTGCISSSAMTDIFYLARKGWRSPPSRVTHTSAIFEVARENQTRRGSAGSPRVTRARDCSGNTFFVAITIMFDDYLKKRL